MTSFGRLDASFIAVLSVTLLAKLAIMHSDPPINGKYVTDPLVSLLREAGMAAVVEPNPPLGGFVYASRGRCKLWAQDYNPYGVYLAEFTDQAKGYGPLRFAYRGKLYERPPKADPLFRFYVGRELTRLGTRTSRYPVIALAASRNCDLDRMNWSRLARVPW